MRKAEPACFYFAEPLSPRYSQPVSIDMNLQEHYDEMRATAVSKFARGEAEPDFLIDSPYDTRRGITLLARPPAHITAIIERIMADFRQSEPDQYYQPAGDIHLTIMSIITCYPGFALHVIDPSDYVSAVEAIVRGIRPFSVEYSGLTAFPGGVIVQGFPQSSGLQLLRKEIRHHFRNSSLQQSIDQRYSIQTAHATVIRFRNPVLNPARLLKMLEKYRQYFIGSFEVSEVALVYNDWYQRAANTVLLGKFTLGTGHQPAWNC